MVKRTVTTHEPRRRFRATCLDAERLRYNSPTLMRVRAEQQWRVASWESTKLWARWYEQRDARAREPRFARYKSPMTSAGTDDAGSTSARISRSIAWASNFSGPG